MYLLDCYRGTLLSSLSNRFYAHLRRRGKSRMEDVQKQVHEAIAVFVPELPHFLESSVSHKNRNPSIKREFPESLPIPGALLRNLKRKKNHPESGIIV